MSPSFSAVTTNANSNQSSGVAQRRLGRDRDAVGSGGAAPERAVVRPHDRDVRAAHRRAGVEPGDEDQRVLRAVLDADPEVGDLDDRRARARLVAAVARRVRGSASPSRTAAQTRPVPPGRRARRPGSSHATGCDRASPERAVRRRRPAGDVRKPLFCSSSSRGISSRRAQSRRPLRHVLRLRA